MQRKRFLTVLALTALVFLVCTAPGLAAPRESDVIHVVQPGDTLYSIALRYGVSVWTIAAANGIADTNYIYVGQRLVIPMDAPSGGVVYTVQPGDTMFGIGRRYGLDAWTIARANGITDLDTIYVGQRLVIPSAAPPAPAPQPPPAPLPVLYPGPWTGEYFGNVTLTGTPYVTRSDVAINFDWGYGSPAGGMTTNYFSVRWTGGFNFADGTYRFYAKADDGVRVYVDGERIIDGWRDGSLRQYSADRPLAAGNHTVRVEYYDSVQVARIYFWWVAVEGPAPTPGPTPTPTPASTPAPPSGGWLAQFYNGENLQGLPAVTRTDPWIGFEWSTGSPAPGVWQDGFSARWTTRAHLETDHYRFCAMSDDGARIWVGGTLVLDEWHANNGTAYCGTYWASSGDYDVKVEYYEHGGNALIYVWWEPE